MSDEPVEPARLAALERERDELEHELETLRVEALWREAELRVLRRSARPAPGSWVRRLFGSPASR